MGQSANYFMPRSVSIDVDDTKNAKAIPTKVRKIKFITVVGADVAIWINNGGNNYIPFGESSYPFEIDVTENMVIEMRTQAGTATVHAFIK